jgi:hypothetical protein
VLVFVGLVAAVLVSMMRGQASPISRVAITAQDDSFTMPTSLPSGLVDIAFRNVGTQPHQANIARLHAGVTPAQFQQQLRQNLVAALDLVTFVGGPNVVDPGGRQDVVINLAAGEYVAICAVTGPDGKPHFMDGMISFFSVGKPSTSQPSAPSASATVTLREFLFTLPTNLKAGSYTWLVTNVGTQPHEMALLKLAPGKSQSDALDFLARQPPPGAPPFAYAGGMGALSPGGSAWLKLTLSKGTYVALCYVPDARNGTPHFMEGMITHFTVS